jgi:glycerol transport system ATP-binding protein
MPATPHPAALALKLEGVEQRVGAATHLYPLNLVLVPGQLNVLLGATLAGKTSLLRLMAGLDAPTAGRIREGAGGAWRDVTGLPVRERDLAMVYQQFINYPSLSVRENIASPLRLRGVGKGELEQRVATIAEQLRLTSFLDRRPAELSGGQQQRTALARALAKDAGLLLLDEPLVNLDYKLREELRAELLQLLRVRNTTVVYATTEPQEALQLGGNVVVMEAGRVVQSGPTLAVFHRPATLAAARAFSDPPLNVLPARFDGTRGIATLVSGAVKGLANGWTSGLTSGLEVALSPAAVAAVRAAGVNEFLLALRPHQLHSEPGGCRSLTLQGAVELAEISGSDTYLHVHTAGGDVVAQWRGIHPLSLGSRAHLFLDPREFFGFTCEGAALFAPTAAAGET